MLIICSECDNCNLHINLEMETVERDCKLGMSPVNNKCPKFRNKVLKVSADTVINPSVVSQYIRDWQRTE